MRRATTSRSSRSASGEHRGARDVRPPWALGSLSRLRRVAHPETVDGEDLVSCPEAGLVGRRAGSHRADRRPSASNALANGRGPARRRCNKFSTGSRRRRPTPSARTTRGERRDPTLCYRLDAGPGRWRIAVGQQPGRNVHAADSSRPRRDRGPRAARPPRGGRRRRRRRPPPGTPRALRAAWRAPRETALRSAAKPRVAWRAGAIDYPVRISRQSQALAKLQSASTVFGETPSTSAISRVASPPKKRISTTRPLRSSIADSRPAPRGTPGGPPGRPRRPAPLRSRPVARRRPASDCAFARAMSTRI